MPGISISKAIGTIAMIFDIHDPRRMIPDNYGDPLNVPVAPPSVKSFHLFCETSQHLLDKLAHQFCADIPGPRRLNQTDFWSFFLNCHNNMDILGLSEMT